MAKARKSGKPATTRSTRRRSPAKAPASAPVDDQAGGLDAEADVDVEAEAQAIRAELAAALGPRLRPEDEPALGILCRAMAALRRSMRELARRPLVTLPNGIRSLNQHAKLAELNRKIIAGLIGRFGLTPADRMKSPARADEPDDDADFTPCVPRLAAGS